MTEFASLAIEREGPVVWITLNRPEKRNAFGPAMIGELRKAFRALSREAEEAWQSGVSDHRPARVVVLRGTGTVFSAGADLEWMKAAAEYDFAANYDDALVLADMLRSVRDCPLPIVARVHGAVMGGGVGLMAACDIAVAAEDTVFAFSEARIGLVPAVIAPFVLPRIGVAAARELFLTGERFDASRAQSVGLVSRVVPEAGLDAAVADRVNALLAASPAAQAAVKELVTKVSDSELDVRDYTARLIAACRASSDGREGMTAFLEKRSPAWVVPSDAGTRAVPADTSVSPGERSGPL